MKGEWRIGTYMYVARVYSEMCLIFLAKKESFIVDTARTLAIIIIL